MDQGSSFWKTHLSQSQYEVLVAARTKCTPLWQTDEHIPSFHRLYYILEGEGRITLDGQIYYPKSGQLVLMPAGVPLSLSAINEHAFLKYWCHFTANINHIPLFEFIQVPAMIDVKDSEKVEQTFKRMIYGYHSSSWVSFFDLQSALIELIYLFIQAVPPSQLQINSSLQSEPHLQKMNQVIAYIDQHLAAPISLPELAGLSHYHPAHFSRVFKRITGYSPMNFVNQRRMDKGKELLVKSTNNISHIAESIGMDIYYFSKRFKEINGFTPSDFLKLFQ